MIRSGADSAGQESRYPCFQEDPMFELNFSSNADWIVAVLLAVTVVAAFV